MLMVRINVYDFSLDKTLESGQTFSWNKVDNYWYNLTKDPIVIRQDNNYIEIINGSESDIKKKLGLNDDINSIKTEIDKVDVLDKAIRFSPGLRVVEDGLWVSTLSFILSIQSNIKLIKRRINLLSEYYGTELEVNGIKMHKFPSYVDIYQGGIEKLKTFKLGFRTEFVFDAAKYFYTHELNEEMEIEEIKANLLKIKGIGYKVLDCILAYGLHDLRSFPIDVWIKRAITKYYNNIVDPKDNYIKSSMKMRDYFGRYASYAQLFLYNYIRLTS